MNIPAESGVMGILAGHVPTIEALKPGVVEVMEGTNGGKKWFSEYTANLILRLSSRGGRCRLPRREGATQREGISTLADVDISAPWSQMRQEAYVLSAIWESSGDFV